MRLRLHVEEAGEAEDESEADDVEVAGWDPVVPVSAGEIDGFFQQGQVRESEKSGYERMGQDTSHGEGEERWPVLREPPHSYGDASPPEPIHCTKDQSGKKR